MFSLKTSPKQRIQICCGHHSPPSVNSAYAFATSAPGHAAILGCLGSSGRVLQADSFRSSACRQAPAAIICDALQQADGFRPDPSPANSILIFFLGNKGILLYHVCMPIPYPSSNQSCECMSAAFG
jgi:hypothetical protein